MSYNRVAFVVLATLARYVELCRYQSGSEQVVIE